MLIFNAAVVFISHSWASTAYT